MNDDTSDATRALQLIKDAIDERRPLLKPGAASGDYKGNTSNRDDPAWNDILVLRLKWMQITGKADYP